MEPDLSLHGFLFSEVTLQWKDECGLCSEVLGSVSSSATYYLNRLSWKDTPPHTHTCPAAPGSDPKVSPVQATPSATLPPRCNSSHSPGAHVKVKERTHSKHWPPALCFEKEIVSPFLSYLVSSVFRLPALPMCVFL